MSLFRRISPATEQSLTQARRDLRDVQQQLEQLGPPPFPLGSTAGRSFQQLVAQERNLMATIGQLGSIRPLAA